MRIRLLGSLVFAGLVVSSAAHADTVTIASGTSPVTYSNASGSGAAIVFQNSPYLSTIPGSSWISTTASGGDGSTGITTYTDTFTLLANETYTGTFSFEADDKGGVVVNGQTVLALDNTDRFFAPTTLDISSFLVSGTNTISIIDSNSGGGVAGVDFVGTFNGTSTGSSVTPEPSSFVLLGTGLVGAIGAARRRFRLA